MGVLEGRIVIVTGAASPGSIGEAIAARAIQEGATVIVTSRKADAARDAARRLGPHASGAGLDLTLEDSVQRFAEDTLRERGRVDGIVHNAGFPVTRWDRSFLDVEVDEYARVFDVDVLGAVRLTRALLPSMRGQRAGSLVFTSSAAAIAGYEYLHEFAPSKAGVLGIMKSLASEFGRDGVRSNAVAYGNIATPPTLQALSLDAQRSLADESPMRRWGEPREAAGACVFLLSDLASFVNGQLIVVDGGTAMR